MSYMAKSSAIMIAATAYLIGATVFGIARIWWASGFSWVSEDLVGLQRGFGIRLLALDFLEARLLRIEPLRHL